MTWARADMNRVRSREMLEQGLLAVLLELHSNLEMGDLPQGFSGLRKG